jgi:hypothetical protein
MGRGCWRRCAPRFFCGSLRDPQRRHLEAQPRLPGRRLPGGLESRRSGGDARARPRRRTGRRRARRRGHPRDRRRRVPGNHDGRAFAATACDGRAHRSLGRAWSWRRRRRGDASMRRPLVRTWSMAWAVALLACDPVPTLTFAPADAAADDTHDTDGPSDSDAVDGGSAAPPEAGCPDRPPSGTSVCCGPVPCTGDCDAGCAACVAKCPSVASVCCAGNGVTCHALGFLCR